MNKRPNIWRRLAITGDETVENYARSMFLDATHESENITERRQYPLKSSVVALADEVAKHYSDPILTSMDWDTLFVTGTVNGQQTLTAVYDPRRYTLTSRRRVGDEIVEYIITVTGRRDCVSAVLEGLEKSIKRTKYAKVQWHYRTEDRNASQTIYLNPPTTKLLPEFYPDLGSPQQFLQEYMDADEAVLLIPGPPGTGKTTLLRHLIYEHNLAAHIVYDEKLMSDDGLFQGYMFGEGDILIIEDADNILTSRELENNRLMARFLNVSDGLIKLPNKKIVFTTNVTDFSKVDQALTRPGRCFGVLHTRPLNLAEAQTAAKVADLPIPTEKREYTIADLFHQKRMAQPMRRIGFVA